MIICGTGHRPGKIHKSDYYSHVNTEKLAEFAQECLEEIKPDKVISGGALGWDQALIRACISLNIPFIAAVPFKGQESKWPPSSQSVYREMLKWAEDVVIVCEGEYSVEKMQTRNIWMCDHSDKVLALWDGSSGGTRNCIEYAKECDKEIINVWGKWIDYK